MREVENVEVLPSRATNIDLGTKGRTPREGIIKVRRARQGKQVVGKGTPTEGTTQEKHWRCRDLLEKLRIKIFQREQ